MLSDDVGILITHLIDYLNISIILKRVNLERAMSPSGRAGLECGVQGQRLLLVDLGVHVLVNLDGNHLG